MFVWQCPLCDECGYFERSTEDALDIACAAHILRHEEESALRAVDKARLECIQPECSLGCRKGYNSAAQIMCPKLTDYDKRFLSGVKISLN